MNKENIRGQCENCGFFYQGEITSPFNGIECQKCGKETNNFDDMASMDAQNRSEGIAPEYVISYLRPLA